MKLFVPIAALAALSGAIQANAPQGTLLPPRPFIEGDTEAGDGEDQGHRLPAPPTVADPPEAGKPFIDDGGEGPYRLPPPLIPPKAPSPPKRFIDDDDSEVHHGLKDSRQIVPGPIPDLRGPPEHGDPHGHPTGSRVPFEHLSVHMGPGPVNPGDFPTETETNQRYSVQRPTPIPESTTVLSVVTESPSEVYPGTPTDTSYGWIKSVVHPLPASLRTRLPFGPGAGKDIPTPSESPSEAHPGAPTEASHDWPTSVAADALPASLRTRLPFGPGAGRDIPIPSEGPTKVTARVHTGKPCKIRTIYTTVTGTAAPGNHHTNLTRVYFSTTFTTLHSKNKPVPTDAAANPVVVDPSAKITCLHETGDICESQFACLADGRGLVPKDDSWVRGNATAEDMVSRFCKLGCFCDNEANVPIIYTSVPAVLTASAEPQSETAEPSSSRRIPFSGDH